MNRPDGDHPPDLGRTCPQADVQSNAENEPDDLPDTMTSRSGFPRGAAILLFAVAGTTHAHAMSTTIADATTMWTALLELIATTYERAPALVLGLAVLLALPPLALVGVALRRAAPMAEPADATRIYRRNGRGRLKEVEPEGDSPPLWPSDAWIQIEGGGRHDIRSGILRLGRDADNDICLDDKTVHRYHAAIHRTDDAAYVITDLSSAGGNGVVVNGHRILEAQLNDGDKIELGQTKLTFTSRPA